jgi:hypothetical protein
MPLFIPVSKWIRPGLLLSKMPSLCPLAKKILYQRSLSFVFTISHVQQVDGEGKMTSGFLVAILSLCFSHFLSLSLFLLYNLSLFLFFVSPLSLSLLKVFLYLQVFTLICLSRQSYLFPLFVLLHIFHSFAYVSRCMFV